MRPDRKSEDFPPWLKSERKRRHLTQKELAELAGISTVMENRYEATPGKSYHAVPRQDVYDRIIKAFEEFDSRMGARKTTVVADAERSADLQSISFGDLLKAVRRHMREMGIKRLEIMSEELEAGRAVQTANPAVMEKGEAMTEIKTIGGGSRFRYHGSRQTGFDIEFGDEKRYHFEKGDVEKLLQSKSGQTVVVGTSRTAPPKNSMGEYLLAHVTKLGVASYVAAILVREGLAEKVSERPATLRFPEYSLAK